MNVVEFEKGKHVLSAIGVSWRSVLAIYIISLAVYGVIAAFQSAPGYMDADYYYAGGLQLSRGEGLWEPFLWNYLDDPQSIPHPSHAYWMPLASWLAVLGMFLTGTQTFNAAQVGMVILAAGIPPLTVILANKLADRSQDAFIAGALALFSGYYFPYLVTTDTFGIYMLLGALFLQLVGMGALNGRFSFEKLMQPVGLGVIAGLMHLARADGLIWLVVGILVGLFLPNRWRRSRSSALSLRNQALWLVGCLAGYLLVMGPWMVRNLTVFGTPLTPGGARALWITNYDELYIYPAGELTIHNWLQAGLWAAVIARWQAFLLNVQTVIAVQGQIFLAPLIGLGAWKLRSDSRVKAGLAAWVLTLVAMTFVFPYQGSRGGLFHSGSAIQPLFWALAPVGLRIIITWGGQIRGWNITQALRVFQFGVIGLAIFLTMLLVAGRMIGPSIHDPVWNQSLEYYQDLGVEIKALGAHPGDVVMVNNAPGFFIATGFPAISVPYGSIDVTMQVGQRYQACYLLLEFNHPTGVASLYRQPKNRPGLIYLKTVAQTHIFSFETCARTSE